MEKNQSKGAKTPKLVSKTQIYISRIWFTGKIAQNQTNPKINLTSKKMHIQKFPHAWRERDT